MTGSRAERLMSNATDVDKVVIINGGEPFLDSTFWYITEQSTGVFEGSLAFVSRDGTVDIMVGKLEEEAAKSSKGNVHVYETRQERDSIVKEILGDAKKVGINAQSAVYSTVMYLKKMKEDIEIVNVSKAIDDTVSVKDEKEIKATEKACEITSRVAQELPDMIHEGVSEKEVAAEIDIRMRRLGGTGNAFETIAAFGSYSAECHHKPCDYRLNRGDTALFDFGSKYDMYCADLTRTIFLGEPPDILRRAYEVVRKAQSAGIEKIRAGASASEPDLAARKIIDDSEFKGKFIHSFGHGIGMDVHQAIGVHPKSEQILKAGNIISAEPGIYIPGIGGIRIEDTVLVTEDGCRILTDYDHGFTVV